MRIGFFCILFLLSSLAEAAPAQVLVTAFAPFAGRPRNGSQIVLELLKRDAPGINTCVLPVEYEKGAEAAKACYQKLAVKPRFVVSLGEAGCDIRLEKQFHNLDDSPKFADNAGAKPVHKIIDKYAAENISSSLPLEKMLASVPNPSAVRLRISDNAGTYVCNGTAFRLEEYFAQEKIPYGLIHVPQVACKDFAPEKTATAILSMLKAADKIYSVQPKTRL